MSSNIITMPTLNDIERVLNLTRKRTIEELTISIGVDEKPYIEYKLCEKANTDNQVIGLLNELDIFIYTFKTKQDFKYYIKYKKNVFILSKQINNESDKESSQELKKITSNLRKISESSFSKEKITIFKNKRRMTLELNEIISNILKSINDWKKD